MTSPIRKIDAHHHLWTLGSPHYPVILAPPSDRYFGNTGGLKHAFEPPDFMVLAARANVVKSVYVESMYAPAIEESARVQAWADQYGFPNAFVANADLASPDLGRDLDIHGRFAGFRGLRLRVNWDEDPQYRVAPFDGMMTKPAWRDGYRELGERGLIAEVLAMPRQLGELAEIAASAPATTLALNHTGMPLRRTAEDERQWRDGMTVLAAMPQVSVKISGLGMIDHAWTAESIRPIVDETIAIFGVDRCVFGSNFPIDGLHASYAAIWEAFETITADHPAADRARLFHDNAERLYRI